MSASKSLEAVARDRVGKGAARAVRRQGQIPAVIYGGNQAPQAIAIELIRTRTLIYAGGFKTTLFDIKVGGKNVRAIPRDYQLDPVSGVPLHVDFLRVVAGQTVTVDVPVHFLNEEAAPGIKQNGGTLNVAQHTLSIEVAPDQIPEAIEVDLTGREIGDAIHVSDIKIPAGTYTGEPTDAVANIVPPTVLGAEVEAEEAAIAEAQSAEAAEEKAEAEAAEGESDEKSEDSDKA
ncbi:50S ribosomal protein L25/general stress protein Ctc [Methylorubrum salsuginis]|uniref:Large ribosomal subunit protein bL25 n=1 Tax=Methylorubrum salsuginis TaxID=414703 RepID=A0A1I4LVY0_9HYPH|nr:50S ribosomal protein L25/general stress protein Ctc [Methylorubrum salsuginis]SFL95130.1 LSU ribosomal protein L25P [Methylorubrum salsuginis]